MLKKVMVGVAILGLIGLAGWLFYFNKSNQGGTNTTQDNTNQQTQTNNDPSEGGKDLVIKEWGVRFELPEELRGDIYYKEWTNESLTFTGIHLSSERLTKLTSTSCDARKSGSGVEAALIRAKDDVDEQFKDDYRRLKDIGEYAFYEYIDPKPGISCATPDPIEPTPQQQEAWELEQKVSSLLAESFKTLEQVKEN